MDFNGVGLAGSRVNKLRDLSTFIPNQIRYVAPISFTA
ncbi:hypothetical protein JCM19240_1258 [Vibrio maritimus]|uniref:Uncharacterized protein n=1 Tax=Vibrio maritimus TaxID=990268 RepID=A0A090T2W8_9VIBR|nr:hypothetical protein JCM19240_1258 [Vibrio maritimus]